MKRLHILFALVVVVLSVEALCAATSVTVVATGPAVTKNQDGSYTITVSGTTTLDMADFMAGELTITVTDPNSQKATKKSLTWTIPTPGQTTNYSWVSESVTIQGEYSYNVRFDYFNGASQSKNTQIGGKFNVP